MEKIERATLLRVKILYFENLFLLNDPQNIPFEIHCRLLIKDSKNLIIFNPAKTDASLRPGILNKFPFNIILVTLPLFDLTSDLLFAITSILGFASFSRISFLTIF